MAYLLKGIDSIDDELLHALREREVTFTEIDLDWALISETTNDDFLNHLYRPVEGKLNENMKIVSGEYADIMLGLRKNYKDYIGHVITDRILILEDISWEQKETSSENSSWKVKLQKTPKLTQELTGWDYIIVTRKFWVDHMDRAQKAAMILGELVRINKDDGSITKPTTHSYSKLTSTFGANWIDKDVKLPDVSKERIELVGFKRANGQITIGDLEGTAVEIEVGEVNEETPEMPFEDDDMLLDPEDYNGEE